MVLPAGGSPPAVRGHEVYTPTMTGLGERSHLLSPTVDLDLHIRDITAVLHYEDLDLMITEPELVADALLQVAAD